MFFKAAKRPPAPAPASAAAAAAATTPATVEGLGRQLREVLPTRRLHSISLCDHEANVLWLSEGALGPDEHSLVTEALALLAADTSLPCHEMGLEDGRLALFLPVRSPTGTPVGIAMILADRKAAGDDTLERMMAAPVRAIMQRLAILLRPADAKANGHATLAPHEIEEEEDPLPSIAARIPVVQPAPSAHAAQASAAISEEEIDDILQFDDVEVAPVRLPTPSAPAPETLMALQLAEAPSGAADMMELDFAPSAPRGPAARTVMPEAPSPRAAVQTPARPSEPSAVAMAPTPRSAPTADTESVAPRPRFVPAPAPAATPVAAAPSPAVLNDPNLMLELLPIIKLRAGGQTRRYQVLARTSGPQREPAAFDALVLQRLLGWLAAHRAAWNSQPTSFTVSLSIATLEDERFAQKLVATLNSHGIAAENLGFEIGEALFTQRRAQVERFINQCDKVGSWVVIDDFSFDSQVLPLLRSKALRMVKIAAKLTSSALKDKLSQAMVVATVQAAKVLGIHCAAKKVDSQAALQWLTAIGCDFAQGAVLATAQPLDALASSPDPTGITAMAQPLG